MVAHLPGIRLKTGNLPSFVNLASLVICRKEMRIAERKREIQVIKLLPKRFGKLKRQFKIRRSFRNTVKSIVHVVMWFVLRRMLQTKHSTINNIRRSIGCMMSL